MHYATPLPMTQHVTDQVYALARQDKMPKGLEIETKTGVVLFDSSWSAGVDYDNNNSNESDTDDETHSDNSEIESDTDEDSELDSELDANEIDNINDMNAINDVLFTSSYSFDWHMNKTG